MNKQILAEYHLLDQEIKGLEAKKDELRKEILSNMQMEGTDKIAEDFGTFSKMVIKRFTYSDNVKQAEENIKIMKKVEEEQGFAKNASYETLRFTSKKAGDSEE